MGALGMTPEPQERCGVLGRLLQTHIHLFHCGLVPGRVALVSGRGTKHLEVTSQTPGGWILMFVV